MRQIRDAERKPLAQVAGFQNAQQSARVAKYGRRLDAGSYTVNTGAKIRSLEMQREVVYRENLRIAGIEPFGLAEQIAYDALLERMDAINEFIRFLESGCKEVKPQRIPATICKVCGSVSHHGGQLCAGCIEIWLSLEETKP